MGSVHLQKLTTSGSKVGRPKHLHNTTALLLMCRQLFQIRMFRFSCPICRGLPDRVKWPVAMCARISRRTKGQHSFGHHSSANLSKSQLSTSQWFKETYTFSA